MQSPPVSYFARLYRDPEAGTVEVRMPGGYSNRFNPEGMPAEWPFGGLHPGGMNMAKDMTEIRWHGRGGQGAKTAAQLVAQVALEEGKYSQGFPEYGPERQGAPIRGFTRISDRSIRDRCPIERPDVVVVLDETLMGTPAVIEAAGEGTVFVINTALGPREMGEKLNVQGSTVFCVDATQISIDELGRPMPNTSMVGALIKATGCISMDAVKRDVEKKFLKKFGQRVSQGNVRAIQRAYEEVRSL